jgi:hypothetical protein
MSQPTGVTWAASLAQRFWGDVLAAARDMPRALVRRRLEVGAVEAARDEASPSVSWPALLLKAFAFTSNAWPSLRRAWLSFPRACIYEHPSPVVATTVPCPDGEEETPLIATLPQPEKASATEVEGWLRGLGTQPLERVATFRRELRASALPRVARRLFWWWVLHVSGRQRARWLGTGCVWQGAGHGSETLQPPALPVPVLSWGPLAPDGSIEVRLSFDPRLLNDGVAGRVLADLEESLCCSLLVELRYLRRLEAA